MLTALRENAAAHEEKRNRGGNAEQESAEMQARVNSAGITDAGDEKDGV